MLLSTWNAAAEPPSPSFSPFSFVVFGDPQLGFGPGGVYADSRRFDQVIEHANQRRAPVVVIPGDLVQGDSAWQRWSFARSVEKITGTVLLTPGNHDVGDEGSLADYRDDFGPDYHDFVYRNCAFVMVDSETARSSEISPQEYTAQWAWLEKTLKGHAAAKRQHVLLFTHRPPFVQSESEPEGEANWPQVERTRLLTLARQYGVSWIVAGHLHRSVTTDTVDAITIAVLPGTAHSYDQSPIGYGVFHVDEHEVQYEFVPVAPAPPPPFHVPGFREWTPRLFDFSPRHWLFSIAYGVAGLFAFAANRRLKPGEPFTHATRLLWLGLAVLLWFYATNMQLDWDELLREVGRGFAKVTGVEAIRHVITGVGLIVFLGGAAIFLTRHYKNARITGATTLALSASLVPTLWFVLSTISHHSLGMVLDETAWDALCVLSVIVVIACARSIAPTARRRSPVRE